MHTPSVIHSAAQVTQALWSQLQQLAEDDPATAVDVHWLSRLAEEAGLDSPRFTGAVLSIAGHRLFDDVPRPVRRPSRCTGQTRKPGSHASS